MTRAPGAKLRVLVVDDSMTVRARLTEVLSREPDLEVVGQAADGKRAIELCESLRPDVVTLDLALPNVDGIEVTEHIMAHAPTPILIVSSSSNRGAMFSTYQALSAGAVDVLDKPADDEGSWDSRFVAAVRMVARIPVITHPRARLRALGRTPTKPNFVPPAAISQLSGRGQFELVAIGASTGGPAALVEVLRHIPATFPIPIVIVLHIDAAFSTAFADWLGQCTARTVVTAADGDHLEPGRIWFAPPDRHLVVRGRRLRLVDDPPRNHCKPSIDVLFESIASDLGDRGAACLLTGMGRDGAAGQLAIRQAGGHTIAQDEATSVVYGMPREAALRGAALRILPLDDIGEAIAAIAGTSSAAGDKP